MTSGHQPDELECVLREKSAQLYQRFEFIRTHVLNKLAARQQKLYDTDAATIHLQTVQRLLGRLIPSSARKGLSGIEVFVLLSAVYLHDIGKIAEAPSGGKHHGLTGRDLLAKHARMLHLEEPEALAIGYVVEGHSMEDIGKLPSTKGVAPHGKVRVQFLAALLQLADNLDMTFTRAPEAARAIVGPPPEAEGKWELRQSVDNVEVDPDTWTILVQATPRTRKQLDAVTRELAVINARLEVERMFLRRNGLYYCLVELEVDPTFLRDEEQLACTGEETAPQSCGLQQLPENAAAIVLKYDDANSLRLYRDVLQPCLTDAGLLPLLIDRELPEDTPLGRTIHLIRGARITIGLLVGDGGPSVNFRLGVAAGLGKPIVVFASPGTTYIVELCDLQIHFFEDGRDLQEKARNLIRSSHVGALPGNGSRI